MDIFNSSPITGAEFEMCPLSTRHRREPTNKQDVSTPERRQTGMERLSGEAAINHGREHAGRHVIELWQWNAHMYLDCRRRTRL